MGALRADARLIGDGGRRVVRVALEPECVAVCLGASRSARRGSTRAGNRRPVFASSVLAPAPSLRTAGHPGCLSSLSSPLVSLSACPNASPVRVSARLPIPESHARESGALWLFVRDSRPRLWKKDYGRGVLCGLLPWEESVFSPFQPSFWVLVGRAGAATGEGRGPSTQRRPHQPAPRTPKPRPGGRRDGARAGPDGRGFYPEGQEGAAAIPGAGRGGGYLGATVLFHRRGRGRDRRLLTS